MLHVGLAASARRHRAPTKTVNVAGFLSDVKHPLGADMMVKKRGKCKSVLEVSLNVRHGRHDNYRSGCTRMHVCVFDELMRFDGVPRLVAKIDRGRMLQDVGT